MAVCGAPLSAVSLLRDGHHWFKSRGGVTVAETPRAMALCSETITAREPLILPDVSQDRRFRDDPLVREAASASSPASRILARRR